MRQGGGERIGENPNPLPGQTLIGFSPPHALESTGLRPDRFYVPTRWAFLIPILVFMRADKGVSQTPIEHVVIGYDLCRAIFGITPGHDFCRDFGVDGSHASLPVAQVLPWQE